MKKGQQYLYNDIIKKLDNETYTEYSYGGRLMIGENFLCFKHNEKDETISFVLTGCNGKGAIYECVYSDL